MFSIRFVAARLASDLSEINFAALCSPISQDHWFWAVAIAGGLRIGSETFFNVTHNFRNPPEEIKEIFPTVITKHQPIDKSLDQYKANELNVSQPAINNSDVTTANALYDLGNILGSTGQFEEALYQLDKAISIDNTNPMYYNNRAAALKRLGRINDALKQYREIIAKFPEYGKAYLSLASTHIEINNYQFSVNSYKDFITAYERGQFTFNPVVGGVSQILQGQNELETIIKTSINYLSSEQQKLALQAFNEACRETKNNSTSSEYSYSSQNYQDYQDSNTKNESRNETDNSINNEQLTRAIENHFIYQSFPRLIILIFITFGLYIAYWYYKHWALFKEYQKDSKINLIICSIFGGISIVGLARRIRKLSLEIETEEKREIKKEFNSFYSFKPIDFLWFNFGIGSLNRLPFPFDLFGVVGSICITLIIYQALLLCLETYLNKKKKLSFLSGGFIGWTIFGIIMWSIYIIGSLPE
jgi:tetratricopeptide (TPR) repeat protein